MMLYVLFHYASCLWDEGAVEIRLSEFPHMRSYLHLHLHVGVLVSALMIIF